MRIPYWLLKQLPMWDYICPKCKREVKQKSHKCPYCGERFPFPLRVPPRCLKDEKALEEYVHKHIFPKVSAWQRDYLAKYFTIIFQDGFESGDFSAWTGTRKTSGDTITVVTSEPHHGTYHSQASMSAVNATIKYAYVYKTVDLAEFYVRFYFKLKDNLPFTTSTDELILIYAAAGTTAIFQAGFSAATKYLTGNYRSGTTWTDWSNTSIHAELDVWHFIEIYWKKDASNGVFRAYYDGVVSYQATGKDTSQYGNVTEIRVGCTRYYFASAQALRVFTDCVVVADTYIGPEVPPKPKGSIVIHAKLAGVI